MAHLPTPEAGVYTGNVDATRVETKAADTAVTRLQTSEK